MASKTKLFIIELHGSSNTHNTLGILGVREAETALLALEAEYKDRGANVHRYHDEALQSATKKGDLEMVRLLLKHGAAVHASNDIALWLAVIYGHLEVVRLLLECGANPNVMTKQWLRRAADDGYFAVVELITQVLEGEK